MNYNKKIKICLAASSGGHLTQLLRLSDSWKEYEAFFVVTSDIVRKELQKYGKVYVVGECNRQHPLQVLFVLLKCIKIVFIEKPQVIISTGAAVGCLTCFTAKIIRAKIIWVDSITNVSRLSLSGQLVKKIADLFFVQWPELAKKYKKTEYLGAI
jgi:beta-1,4-N-acetylglucosaminyltransferase